MTSAGELLRPLNDLLIPIENLCLIFSAGGCLMVEMQGQSDAQLLRAWAETPLCSKNVKKLCSLSRLASF